MKETLRGAHVGRKLQTGSSNGRCSISVEQMTVRGVLLFSFELFILFCKFFKYFFNVQIYEGKF